MTERSK